MYLQDLAKGIACTKLILLSIKPAENAPQPSSKPIRKMERPVNELLQGKLSGLKTLYQNLTRSWVLKLSLFNAMHINMVTVASIFKPT